MVDELQQPQASRLQRGIEKVKGAVVLNNTHNLVPPMNRGSDDGVAIKKALESEQYINKTVLQLQGYIYNPITDHWEAYRKPVMNPLGIGALITVITNIVEELEFSNIHEDEIGTISWHLWASNFCDFAFHHEDYDLDVKDLNIIDTALTVGIISATRKAKGAGHRNVIRGVMDEQTIRRAFEDEKNKKGLTTGIRERLLGK